MRLRRDEGDASGAWRIRREGRLGQVVVDVADVDVRRIVAVDGGRLSFLRNWNATVRKRLSGNTEKQGTVYRGGIFIRLAAAARTFVLSQFPNRSVGELIQYYYLWKKTEMHDLFMQQYHTMGNSDYMNPGQLDGLDKYGDTDLESSRAPSPAPSKISEIVDRERAALLSVTHPTTAAAAASSSGDRVWSLKVDGRKRKAEKDEDNDGNNGARNPKQRLLEVIGGGGNTPPPQDPVESLLASEILPESSDDSFHETKAQQMKLNE
eukprot:m.78875 g.78875  ORF g.78875 m.78875 type:complete len:265 (+) comp36117_c0_seq3:1865-2659(+)